MSVTLTARSRALLVLLVAALVAVSWATAFAGGDRPGRVPAGSGAVVQDDGSESGTADQQAPEIGTALKMVRNADGSVTVTES